MKGPYTLGLSGTGGRRVRETGSALMSELVRSGLHAWGWCRDDGDVTRFRIGAGPSPGAMVANLRILEADLDAGRIVDGEREFEVPRERLGAGLSGDGVVLGALSGLYGLKREVGPSGDKSWAAGFDYASANFPDLDSPVPECAGLGDVLVLTGRSSFAAGAASAGCRYVCGTRPLGEFEEIANSGIPFALERCEDGDAAVYRAAGAGYAGVRALTVVDERAHRRAEEAIRWAARAEIPFVLLVVDAGESSFRRAPTLAGPSAPGTVLVPSSIEDLYHAMGEAFTLAEKFRSPVTILADRLLTERWETVADPVVVKSAGRAERPVPGQKGRTFSVRSGVDEETLRAKCEDLRAAVTPPRLAGAESADATLVCAGGTSVAVRWAADKINQGTGRRVNVVVIRTLIPFLGSAAYGALRESRRLIVVEGTPGRPLHRWLRMAAGLDASKVVSLEEPFDPEATLNALLEAVEGE